MNAEFVNGGLSIKVHFDAWWEVISHLMNHSLIKRRHKLSMINQFQSHQLLSSIDLDEFFAHLSYPLKITYGEALEFPYLMQYLKRKGIDDANGKFISSKRSRLINPIYYQGNYFADEALLTPPDDDL